MSQNQEVVTAGQSLLDVTVQELGSVAALFDLADANSLAITDLLTPGQVLTVPASPNSMPAITSYFSQRGQRINTGDVATPASELTSQRYFSSLFFNPDTYA